MDWDHWYFEAFWNLSTCRSFGMAVGPIPYNLTKQYGVDAGLDEDSLEVFLQVMRAMDVVYLADVEEQRALRQEPQGPATPPPAAAPAIRVRRVAGR